jgi:hypothetical protein
MVREAALAPEEALASAAVLAAVVGLEVESGSGEEAAALGLAAVELAEAAEPVPALEQGLVGAAKPRLASG